jgi:hypothetical protein
MASLREASIVQIRCAHQWCVCLALGPLDRAWPIFYRGSFAAGALRSPLRASVSKCMSTPSPILAAYFPCCLMIICPTLCAKSCVAIGGKRRCGSWRSARKLGYIGRPPNNYCFICVPSCCEPARLMATSCDSINLGRRLSVVSLSIPHSG